MATIKTNTSRSRMVWVAWFCLVTLTLALAPAGYAKKDKKKGKTPETKPQSGQIDRSKIDTSKLVWPQPPDLPRIKFLSESFGEAPKAVATGKTKKKKQGWMDRMAGVRPDADAGPGERRHVLSQPYGVVVDSKGRVYVADTYVDAVFIFNLETKQVSLIRNGFEGQFKSIIGLAIDDTDRLFVADAGFHQVSVFGANGKQEAVFGEDQLGRPTGIAIDTENRFVYVVDTEKEQIAVFDADNFKFLRTLGGPAKREGDEDPGTFAKPTNATVDEDGNLYVTDTLNNRVQIFDADGKFISMFGKQGDAPGTFQRPKGIAIDSDGHIWVVDAAQDNVQIYDKEGHLLAYFGYGGTYPGQFALPAGIFIDKLNRVIVSDQLKGRIQIFRYITEAENAAAKAEVNKPRGAAVSTTQTAEAAEKK